MSSEQAIGFFGGTFNPIHRGHLETVAHVRDELGLEQVHVTPVSMPSHRAAPGVTGEMRFAMVRLAVDGQGDGALIADRRELDREGPSYTYDSLVELRREYGPKRPIVLILGMDSFVSLPTWYRWDELLELVHIAVMRRPGAERPDPRPSWWTAALTSNKAVVNHHPNGSIVEIETPELPISSTSIRRQLTAGEMPEAWLEPGVITYIQRHGLYGSVGSDDSGGAESVEIDEQPEAPVPAPSVSPAAPDDDAEQVRDVVVEAMDDAKARDIRALDVRGMTDVTDFMVIATGTSDRHLSAVADSVRTGLKDANLSTIGSEGDDGGDWVLIDCGPVVAHVMRREAREFYDLDGLWSDEVRELIRAQRDGDIET